MENSSIDLRPAVMDFRPSVFADGLRDLIRAEVARAAESGDNESFFEGCEVLQEGTDYQVTLKVPGGGDPDFKLKIHLEVIDID